MEQLYMLEIFVDKVSIFVRDDDQDTNTNKGLILKIKFGPRVQFIVREGQLAHTERNEAIVEEDENGQRKWNRTIRVGKSYLFPSYPDTMIMILSKFPLEVEVYTDDYTEQEIFVGIGNMHFDTGFFFMLKETMDTCKLYDPLAIKQTIPITAECCCRQVGEVSFIVRLSALGDSIITEFQQLVDKDPDLFVFRTNKAPSMFECKRVEGDDPNFCMVGSLYETATLEDPDIIAAANKKIEVCTELQSCGVGPPGATPSCQHEAANIKTPKEYPIEKIRMGDITGPCGNTNCPLAHKIKTYIRNLDAYKKETQGKTLPTQDAASKKVCGSCSCKDDKYHRDKCPENEKKPICHGCGGVAQSGQTCEDRVKKMHGTGLSPKQSLTKTGPPKVTMMVHTVTRDPELMKEMFGQEYFVGNCAVQYPVPNLPPTKTCGCKGKALEKAMASSSTQVSSSTPQYSRSQTPFAATVYNAEVKTKSSDARGTNTFCTDIPDDKDCKCAPPKPTPPCKTIDCECLTEAVNIDARKKHKPYCPSYKHKVNCPVTMIDEEENHEFEEDEAEPLPYGLPPVQLGPCPVLGRPCTVPDGFARMYKSAVMPTQPPSYSEAGKVCCSKEYERIKKAIKDYMTNHKDDDYRCVNKFNVDTERRCCDKEQRLLALMGKSCCGSHKLAIQQHYKEKLEMEASEKRNS